MFPALGEYWCLQSFQEVPFVAPWPPVLSSHKYADQSSAVKLRGPLPSQVFSLLSGSLSCKFEAPLSAWLPRGFFLPVLQPGNSTQAGSWTLVGSLHCCPSVRVCPSLPESQGREVAVNKITESRYLMTS